MLYTNMSARKIVQLCWLFLVFRLSNTTDNKPKDIQIVPEYVPEDCYEKSADGDQILVHYTGSLESGQVFDSSRNRGEPFGFVLGEGKVIQGWEIGLLGMCVGEKRRLIIPPHLGYGSQGSPPAIPSDAYLIFETEMVGINKESFDQTLFRILRFLGFPSAAGLIVYYLYQRYQKEASERLKEKEEKKNKKKRR